METQEDSCKLNQWDVLPLPSLGRIYSAGSISLHLDQIAACEELYPWNILPNGNSKTPSITYDITDKNW